MSDVTLNCLILGEPPEKIFPVDIARSNTVDALKGVIKDKKQRTFQDVDADDLILYSTFFRFNGEKIEQELNSFRDKLGSEKPLQSASKLANIFADLSEDDLHVIVRSPLEVFQCWVRGTPAKCIFPVEISSAASISDLKNAIGDKKQVDCRSDDIKIYKFVAALDKDSNFLECITLSDVGTPLCDQQVLSTLFPSPLENHLHFVVDTSHLNVHCWARGQDRKNGFVIRTQSTITVNALKNRVIEGHPFLGDIHPSCIVLFKISQDDSNLGETLCTAQDGQLLDGGQTISMSFMDVPLAKEPSIVVEVDTSHPWSPIQVARAKFVESLPEKFAAYPHRRICGHPCFSEQATPLELLHPVFGQFVDDRNTHKLTPDDAFVMRLEYVMADMYKDVADRIFAVDRIFRNYGINLSFSKMPGYETIGDISVNGNCYVIAEFSNELSNMTSFEGYFQAALHYLESTRGKAPRMTGSSLPCFLLAVSGCHLIFAGVAWNLHPTVQILSLVSFQYHSTDCSLRTISARHMAALRKAVQSLKEYYEGDAPFSIPSLYHPHLFPYPTSLKSLDGNSLIEFRYQKQPFEEELVFLGRIEGTGGPICIKFVRHYSLEAHKLCESFGCAPTLRGFERIPGDWFMVVMDTPPNGYVSLHDGTTVSQSVLANISHQLKRFHEEGFVFGNICDTNILVSCDDSKKFMMTDFDLAGKVGVIRYPFRLHVDGKGIWRPDDVKGGDLIQAEHDLAMLNHIADSHQEKVM